MPLIAKNKKAYYDYNILETFEAGIVLTGPEVKSIKNGQIDLKGGFIALDNKSNCWLNNVYVAPYKPAALGPEYRTDKPRKLLLKKREINYLIGKLKIKGLTMIPLKVYTKGNLIKIEIGLAKGKKKWDKREAIKKKEVEKKMRQQLKNSKYF